MRPKAGTLRTLDQLLDAQSATTRKHPAFPRLVELLRESAQLRRLRLGPRAWRLLNEARIEERFLVNFYATYRIPECPFFPLFLQMVRDCREKREAARLARGRRIIAIMRTYPWDVLGLIKYLAKVERELNGEFPVWKKDLFPRTLTRARELAVFDLAEWLPFLSRYLVALRSRYRRLELADSETLFACMLLGCLSDPRTGVRPGSKTIARRYRELRAAYSKGSVEERKRLPLLNAARAALAARGRIFPDNL